MGGVDSLCAFSSPGQPRPLSLVSPAIPGVLQTVVQNAVIIIILSPGRGPAAATVRLHQGCGAKPRLRVRWHRRGGGVGESFDSFSLRSVTRLHRSGSSAGFSGSSLPYDEKKGDVALSTAGIPPGNVTGPPAPAGSCRGGRSFFLPISTFPCTDYVKYFSKLIFCTSARCLCTFHSCRSPLMRAAPRSGARCAGPPNSRSPAPEAQPLPGGHLHPAAAQTRRLQRPIAVFSVLPLDQPSEKCKKKPQKWKKMGKDGKKGEKTPSEAGCVRCVLTARARRSFSASRGGRRFGGKTGEVGRVSVAPRGPMGGVVRRKGGRARPRTTPPRRPPRRPPREGGGPIGRRGAERPGGRGARGAGRAPPPG